MAKTQQEMAEAMKTGILDRTGHPLDHWVRLVRQSGLEKHGDQMKLLKDDHGFTHGYANFVCQAAKGRLETSDDDLLAGQYTGKEGLRPIYDRLVEYARSLGTDVHVAPKKTSVALRRSKNFAVVSPAAKSRIDLGLNLKGTTATARLKAERAGSMCTHKVALNKTDDIDQEVLDWIRQAYEKA